MTRLPSGSVCMVAMNCDTSSSMCGQ
jgi:hypothetical protein